MALRMKYRLVDSINSRKHISKSEFTMKSVSKQEYVPITNLLQWGSIDMDACTEDQGPPCYILKDLVR